jgi:hypothetical protein
MVFCSSKKCNLRPDKRSWLYPTAQLYSYSKTTFHLRNSSPPSSPNKRRFSWRRMTSATAAMAGLLCGRRRLSGTGVELVDSVPGRGLCAVHRLRSGELCWDVSTGVYLSFHRHFFAISLGRCSRRRGTWRWSAVVHVQRIAIQQPSCSEGETENDGAVGDGEEFSSGLTLD